MRAARHFTAGPRARMVLFFGDMLTCSHVSSARNIVGGQLFRVSGNYVTTSFFFFFLLFPSTCGRTLGCCYRCWQVLYREKFFPPTSRRLFRDQQDKNCAEETPVLTRKTSQVWCFRRVIPLVRSTIFWTTIFPLWKWHHFQRLFNFYFLYPEKNTQRQLQQCCRGGEFVNGYGSRNMFGAPDATPEVDFFFFGCDPNISKKKNTFFHYNEKQKDVKYFPKKTYTQKCVVEERIRKYVCRDDWLPHYSV